ncbi:MAG: hypothetical protein ACF8Q5_05640 [Phycisphaerales bacterium JB040]
MVEEAAGWVAQFGVAGLVAWMWLSERRASGVRERQMTELHNRLMLERQETEVLVKALNDNTRALASLEASQRGLLVMLARGGGLSEERAGVRTPGGAA